MTPGRFFVLKFDFSTVNRCPNIVKADERLKDAMDNSFTDFYTTYATFFGEDTTKLFANIIHDNPTHSLKNCTRLVQNTLSKARENGEEHKRLAEVLWATVLPL